MSSTWRSVVARAFVVLAWASAVPAAACSSSSASSGGATSVDAALASACATANQPPETACPVADAGTCYEGTCNPAALPTGMACSGGACLALIDPCGDLMINSRTDYYACDCLDGAWVCGLCAAGTATCVDAGADAPAE